MDYPDWIIRASEVGSLAALVAMFFAIFYVAAMLRRFQMARRGGAILMTLSLGFAGGVGAAIALTTLVGVVHNDHQSNGGAIGWAMMVGYPALFLAGPVALIMWSVALISGAKALPETGGASSTSTSQGTPAQRRGRFQARD